MRIKIYFSYKQDDCTTLELDTPLSKQAFIENIVLSKGFWYKSDKDHFFIPWHKINSFEILK